MLGQAALDALDRGEDIALQWAAPCVTASVPPLRGNTFGWLLHTRGERGGLDFVYNAESNPRIQPVKIAGCKAMHRKGLVSDRVVIYETTEGKKQTFQFDRSRREHAIALAQALNLRARDEKAAATVLATA